MKNLQPSFLWILVITVFLLTSCGTYLGNGTTVQKRPSPIDQGLAFYNAGQFDQADAYWIGPAYQGNYIAQYNMGVLWANGLGSKTYDPDKARNWFYQSANHGYVPAMVRLAETLVALNREGEAIPWLGLAARWGNDEAIHHLRRMGRSVPNSDLYNAQQRQIYAQQQQDLQTQVLMMGVIQSNNALIMNNLNIISNNVSGSPNTNPSYNSGSSNASRIVSSAKPCASDHSCGIDHKCVKAPYESSGVCMKTVNEHGNKQHTLPDPDSLGVSTTKQCLYDTQCPQGFRCDGKFKACVKK